MLIYILIGLAVLVVIILIAASAKPDTVCYERSVVISAPPDRILPHITDFHKWSAWSPWEKKDPDMKRKYTGTPSGKGAKYAWIGNGKVGEGSMEVRDVISNAVNIDMRFIKPFKNDCDMWFRCTPEGPGTKVNWSMESRNLFMGKVMSLLINMDKMIGKDFENGLADLKKQAETN
ncbi:MAG: SRPBCC family protein [Flavobacteriales bacterium]|nr:SRPBCC family protein [Flavobacteriales bacterium]MBK6943765.1 SRPBCC family protein [Flavobacteriales bacterium]MBK7239977.1 SRPBCC family protein [Flavobacteriales bacterium]MBK7297020.1 SRPBCC family protein [Flavobacteriales bacterium]MBK9535703.1 SRPBCC family protein [Flavobacteriales bacterium]